MTESASDAVPGTTRPGGRTSRVRSAVFEAALAVLGDLGYVGLSIERIAERSGVNKTTIYRRWQTKEAVLAAALDEMASAGFPMPITGSIDDDLRAFGHGIVDFLTDDTPSTAALVRALFSDAAREPLIAELRRNFFAHRYRDATKMVDAAIEQGTLPADVDAREFVGLVAAPIYYRHLVTEEPLDYAVSDRAALNALTAVRAGACRR
jgi:AcrR family transcriptional regulator